MKKLILSLAAVSMTMMAFSCTGRSNSESFPGERVDTIVPDTVPAFDAKLQPLLEKKQAGATLTADEAASWAKTIIERYDSNPPQGKQAVTDFSTCVSYVVSVPGAMKAIPRSEQDKLMGIYTDLLRVLSRYQKAVSPNSADNDIPEDIIIMEQAPGN